jgi:hypothetical protein
MKHSYYQSYPYQFLFYKPAVLLSVYFIIDLWSHQESNLDLKFRKLLFYPLNYETFHQMYKIF